MGFGDLIVTCLSEHSRNRKAGLLIGQGKTLEETKKEVGMVIENTEFILHVTPSKFTREVFKKYKQYVRR